METAGGGIRGTAQDWQPLDIRQPLTKALVVVIWIGREPMIYAAGSS